MTEDVEEEVLQEIVNYTSNEMRELAVVVGRRTLNKFKQHDHNRKVAPIPRQKKDKRYSLFITVSTE